MRCTCVEASAFIMFLYIAMFLHSLLFIQVFPLMCHPSVYRIYPHKHTRVMHAFYWDEVYIRKNDVLHGCVSTVASSKIFVIDPLIINPSFHMVQHILPMQFAIHCPVVWLISSALHQYHLPATGPWLAQEGNGLLKEREREGIGRGKCTEINLVKCTRLYVGQCVGL